MSVVSKNNCNVLNDSSNVVISNKLNKFKLLIILEKNLYKKRLLYIDNPICIQDAGVNIFITTIKLTIHNTVVIVFFISFINFIVLMIASKF